MAEHGEHESAEFGRWQGQIDTRLDTHGKHLSSINGDLKTVGNELSALRQMMSNELTDLKVLIAGLRVKVAVFVAVGGLVGAGVVTVAVQLIIPEAPMP